MKPLKMLAAAVLAALAAMSFVGISSAMAESTDLCTAEENPCAESHVVTHLHETSVGKAKLLSSLPTVECNVLFLGDAAGESGSVFNGKFTYSSCNNFCTLAEASGSEPGATLSFLRTGTELANVSGGTEVHLNCPFVNCIYSVGIVEGHGLGALTSSSTNGSTVISEQEMESVSGSCPEKTSLDLTTTPLAKTYLTEAGKEMLCVQVNWGWYDLFNDGKVCKAERWLPFGRYELTFRLVP
jgi:hypothetical protein